MVAALPTNNFPEGSTPQASAAGIQDKLLLIALPGYRSGMGIDGCSTIAPIAS